MAINAKTHSKVSPYGKLGKSSAALPLFQHSIIPWDASEEKTMMTNPPPLKIPRPEPDFLIEWGIVKKG